MNASDYKNANESFGTVALRDQALADAANNVEVDNDMRLTGDVKCLCKSMGVKSPFLPVHGDS